MIRQDDVESLFIKLVRLSIVYRMDDPSMVRKVWIQILIDERTTIGALTPKMLRVLAERACFLTLPKGAHD
jgi:hypothetical protein